MTEAYWEYQLKPCVETHDMLHNLLLHTGMAEAYWEYQLQTRCYTSYVIHHASHMFPSPHTGMAEAYWEFQLKPWDVCAGVIILKEAGGAITTIDNQMYRCVAGKDGEVSFFYCCQVKQPLRPRPPPPSTPHLTSSEFWAVLTVSSQPPSERGMAVQVRGCSRGAGQ